MHSLSKFELLESTVPQPSNPESTLSPIAILQLISLSDCSPSIGSLSTSFMLIATRRLVITILAGWLSFRLHCSSR